MAEYYPRIKLWQGTAYGIFLWVCISRSADARTGHSSTAVAATVLGVLFRDYQPYVLLLARRNRQAGFAEQDHT